MKLARPAPLSKVVRTICLPLEEEKPRPGLQCVTSGWGRSGPSPSLSNALLEANVPLLELDDCLKAYGKSVPIRDGHLCAGNTDGSSGSCVVSCVFLGRAEIFVHWRCQYYMTMAIWVGIDRMRR